MSTKTKGKIVYGNVNIPDEAFAPAATRVRISIMVPGDVIAKLRELGEKLGKGYQTVTNDILRVAVMGDDSLDSRKLSKRIDQLETRMNAALEKLEAATGKQPEKRRARAGG